MADRPRRPGSMRDMAEAAFKTATTKPVERLEISKPATIPNAKEARLAAYRSRCPGALSGGRPRLAGADQRGAAKGGGTRLRTAGLRKP